MNWKHCQLKEKYQVNHLHLVVGEIDMTKLGACFVTVWNLGNTGWCKEFWGCVLLMQERPWSVDGVCHRYWKRKSECCRCASCLGFRSSFTLVRRGRYFLVLISCLTRSSGYPKLLLPGTWVEEYLFLLLTEIYLFLLLQKLSWSSFNCPNWHKDSLNYDILAEYEDHEWVSIVILWAEKVSFPSL